MDLSSHKQFLFVKKGGLDLLYDSQVGSTAWPGAVSSVCVEQEKMGPSGSEDPFKINF